MLLAHKQEHCLAAGSKYCNTEHCLLRIKLFFFKSNLIFVCVAALGANCKVSAFLLYGMPNDSFILKSACRGFSVSKLVAKPLRCNCIVYTV